MPNTVKYGHDKKSHRRKSLKDKARHMNKLKKQKREHLQHQLDQDALDKENQPNEGPEILEEPANDIAEDILSQQELAPDRPREKKDKYGKVKRTTPLTVEIRRENP